MTPRENQENRYAALIESIFFDQYRKGMIEFLFHRDALTSAATKLDIILPKNLGDVIYSIRYRMPLPRRIIETQPEGKEWVIEGGGRAQYVFRLVAVSRIRPNENLASIKIPDATPEIISAYAMTDEQALLAKVRYNRLLDIFLGVTTYSLQNHLRTTVDNIGQVEIDEVYVGIDKGGRQYILPVQAKGGSDQISTVQTKQDLACCASKFPLLKCRPISAQFVKGGLIALFELGWVGEQIKIIEERHYKLVPSSEISTDDLKSYDS